MLSRGTVELVDYDAPRYASFTAGILRLQMKVGNGTKVPVRPARRAGCGFCLDGRRVLDNASIYRSNTFGSLTGSRLSWISAWLGLRLGGRIVMGNWIPNDPTSFRVAVAEDKFDVYTSTSGRVHQSHDLGCGYSRHRAFWSGWSAQREISMVKDTFHFISPDKGPSDLIESFRLFDGPTMNAYEAAEKSGKVEELHKQLLELANVQNTSTGVGTSIPATFLRVTVSLWRMIA